MVEARDLKALGGKPLCLQTQEDWSRRTRGDAIAAYHLANDVFRAKGANAYLMRATSSLEEVEEFLKSLSDASKVTK